MYDNGTNIWDFYGTNSLLSSIETPLDTLRRWKFLLALKKWQKQRKPVLFQFLFSIRFDYSRFLARTRVAR
jgi:hypothetical protein